MVECWRTLMRIVVKASSRIRGREIPGCLTAEYKHYERGTLKGSGFLAIHPLTQELI